MARRKGRGAKKASKGEKRRRRATRAASRAAAAAAAPAEAVPGPVIGAALRAATDAAVDSGAGLPAAELLAGLMYFALDGTFNPTAENAARTALAAHRGTPGNPAPWETLEEVLPTMTIRADGAARDDTVRRPLTPRERAVILEAVDYTMPPRAFPELVGEQHEGRRAIVDLLHKTSNGIIRPSMLAEFYHAADVFGAEGIAALEAILKTQGFGAGWFALRVGHRAYDDAALPDLAELFEGHLHLPLARRVCSIGGCNCTAHRAHGGGGAAATAAAAAPAAPVSIDEAVQRRLEEPCLSDAFRPEDAWYGGADFTEVGREFAAAVATPAAERTQRQVEIVAAMHAEAELHDEVVENQYSGSTKDKIRTETANLIVETSGGTVTHDMVDRWFAYTDTIDDEDTYRTVYMSIMDMGFGKAWTLMHRALKAQGTTVETLEELMTTHEIRKAAGVAAGGASGAGAGAGAGASDTARA